RMVSRGADGSSTGQLVPGPRVATGRGRSLGRPLRVGPNTLPSAARAGGSVGFIGALLTHSKKRRCVLNPRIACAREEKSTAKMDPKRRRRGSSRSDGREDRDHLVRPYLQPLVGLRRGLARLRPLLRTRLRRPPGARVLGRRCAPALLRRQTLG